MLRGKGEAESGYSLYAFANGHSPGSAIVLSLSRVAVLILAPRFVYCAVGGCYPRESMRGSVICFKHGTGEDAGCSVYLGEGGGMVGLGETELVIQSSELGGLTISRCRNSRRRGGDARARASGARLST